MNRFSIALLQMMLGVGLVIFVAACSSDSGSQPAAQQAPAAPSKVDATLNASNATMVLNVQGMVCEHNCVSKVTAALSAIPAVQAVRVSLADAKAYIKCDPAQCDGKACVDAVSGAGFTAALAPAALPDAPAPAAPAVVN